MPPAARVGDVHTCPMVTPGTPPIPHVGGPILPPGAPTVLIDFIPAATVTNMATCVGPPDVIVEGSTGVFINYLPAARLGDQTAHGGVIVMGSPTCIIGEVGSPSPGAAGLGGILAGLILGAIVGPMSPVASVLAKGAKSDNPPYEPKRWNQQPVKGSTNCYAYAANDPDGHPPGKPQPGEHCGSPAASPSCADVTKASVCDGMIPAPKPTPKSGYYVVALVSAPGKDYHWYRQDDNGNWSHKPGNTDATNVDASGNIITNPETADRAYGRLNYSQFCGYFYVPAGGIRTGPP
jgi:uncharacterized Zn-binding protein involved in type VI secretion